MTCSLAANRQRGFILATTLWMMAIVTVLATMFHGYVEAQLDRAGMVRQQMQNQLDMLNTGTTVHYLLATRRVTRAGLTLSRAAQQSFIDEDGNIQLAPIGGELRLDGSRYRGSGRASFSIQDQAGLLAANSPSAPATLLKLLADSAGTQRARQLSASLADYIDENSNKRLNGAEEAQYRSGGLPPPPNWYLRSDVEIGSVFGWADWLASPLGAPWREWLAITHAGLFNVNTAPVGLLAVVLNIDVPEAELLVQARTAYPFRSLDGVAEKLKRLNRWEEERFRFFPDNRLELRLWCEGCNYGIVQSLELTANGLYGPWLMDYSYRKSVNKESVVREIDARAAPSVFTKTLLVAE